MDEPNASPRSGSERPKVLDCTLRDGGYYNRWDFESELVDAYLESMAAIPVDAVELGFRFRALEGFHGPFAYTTDDFLSSLSLPEGPLLGVMVNASDVVRDGRPGAVIDELFDQASNSPVRLVRIAAHYREIDALGPAVDRLSSLGYRIGLNVMQAGERSETELSDVAKWAAERPIEVLYFADSLGNMDAERVAAIVSGLQQSFPREIGIHTHDNMQRALVNSIAAAQAGATWLDGTVTGMGRGAGNVKTEYLLLELNRLGVADYDVFAFLDLVSRHFEPLQREFDWGPNLYYYLSGAERVHPTYVQQMLGDRRYSSEEIVTAIRFLRDREGHSYKAERLEAAQPFAEVPAVGDWSAEGWAQDQDVLLVANGDGAERHRVALKQKIHRAGLRVIALNLHVPVDSEDVSLWAACHPDRIVMDIGRYAELDQPLLTPVSALPESVRSSLQPEQLLDYGLRVEAGTFLFEPRGCVVPRALVAAYALAMATAAGARRIFLAGFDGFPPGDARQAEMSEVLKTYQASEGACPLLALTPSTYPVPQGSVYAPIE